MLAAGMYELHYGDEEGEECDKSLNNGGDGGNGVDND